MFSAPMHCASRGTCRPVLQSYTAAGHTLSLVAFRLSLVADARERRLRSTESRTCVVARTYSSFGDRAFAAAMGVDHRVDRGTRPPTF